MREQIIHYYRCDHCNKAFNTKEKCLAHENKHFLPLGIIDQTFLNYNESNDNSLKYPRVIVIKFEDKCIHYQMKNDYDDQEEFED